MAKPVATPSYHFFECFNAFFSTIWQKTQVGLVSLKVFHLWRILGHPIITQIESIYNYFQPLIRILTNKYGPLTSSAFYNVLKTH